VDVFTARPEPRRPSGGPDVTGDEDAAGQSNRERDARIEEMERALDSFSAEGRPAPAARPPA